jgi:hypothetical protein
MLIFKSIAIEEWNDETKQRIIAFWEKRRMVFTDTQGDTLRARRGNLLGNLTAVFDMSRVVTTLTVVTAGPQWIQCMMDVDASQRNLTVANNAFLNNEMEAFAAYLAPAESTLLRAADVPKQELLRATAGPTRHDPRQLLRPSASEDATGSDDNPSSHHTDGQPVDDDKYRNYECTAQAFRPCLHYPVRWLDVEADYDLVRAYWSTPLSREDWRQFSADGYRYAAIVEDGVVVSLAAAWCYSDTAWEVAAVSTVAAKRRQCYAKTVVSFVTAHILASGRKATCLTMHDNKAMQRTAESLGFYLAE